MRRNAADILFVYHYTHRVRRPFLPSVSSPSPFSSLSPVPLIGPSSLSSPLVFLVLLFSLSLCTTRFASRRVYLFYFIIKQTPLPVILAPTCVFTRTHGIHVKHSLHLTRGSAYATVPDTKNIFSLPSSHSRYHSPFTYPALSERLRWVLIVTLKGIFHLRGILNALEARLKIRIQKLNCNTINTRMQCYI